MSVYTKIFDTHFEYESYINTIASPNISYCKDHSSVHFINENNPDLFAYQYFTITALENGSIQFVYNETVSTSNAKYIEYSLDNGNTWIKTNNINNEVVTITINVSKDDIILWRGDNNKFCYHNTTWGTISNGYSYFKLNCRCDISGNIMSLLYKNDFMYHFDLNYDGIFIKLFSPPNYNNLIINAKYLILPATKLSSYCYGMMFEGCTSLITAPELPATILKTGCYFSMFNGCSSLTIAPELPAETILDTCYYYMFNNCTSLNYIKAMYTTDLSYDTGLSHWIDNVALNGTFVKNAASQLSYDVPNGWTIISANS